MHTGLHHAEKRKREGVADTLDHIMIFVGLVGPLSLLPQVIKIWTDRNVASISPLSWILLGLVSTAWVVYGVIRRSNAIVIGNTLLAILNFLVAVAYYMFR